MKGLTATSQALSALDESGIHSFQWRAVVTSGLGFFTDAYDLFIIGTVTAILTPIWHLGTGELALLNSLSLAGAAIGALTFGRLMDRFGRRKIYGLESIILTLGAVASALAPSYGWLLLMRVIVGFGVGGNYPTTSVITSEYSNRKNRGFLVTLVFAMQGLGLLAGPVVAAILLSSGMPHAIAWRLMLALGAIPAAMIIYQRRNLPETPRYLAATGKDEELNRVVETVVTREEAQRSVHHAGTQGATPLPQRIVRQSLWTKSNLLKLVATAGSWFLIDVAFYGNGVSSQLILKALLPHSALAITTLVAGAIFLVAAVPGYLVAAVQMDKMGRRLIQIVGFSVMALAYAAIFLVPTIIKIPIAFLAVYATSYFFTEFGPNTTTFLVPAEAFATNVRGTAHGISAGAGKLGAFVGAFFLPLVLKSVGLSSTMGLLALVALAGAGLTVFLLPEMNQQSLESTESFVQVGSDGDKTEKGSRKLMERTAH